MCKQSMSKDGNLSGICGSGLFCLVSLVFAMGPGAGTVNADITSDLVGHWTFDEGSGDVAKDSSGSDFHGALSGNPAWISGPLGGALAFDGTDDIVDTGTGLLDGLPEFTLACWVNAENYTTNRIGLIGQNDLIEFGFNGGGDLRCWSTGGLGNVTVAYPHAYPSWHHVAAIGDAAGKKLFIDGQQVVGPGNAPANDYGTSTFNFNIGAAIWDGTGNWFLGEIDDVRVYTRALTDADMQELLVWIGQAPGQASNPTPAQDETDVLRDEVFGWTAGDFANTHDVYLGTVLDDVNDASSANPGAVLVGQGLADTTFDPGRLEFDQSYYWRVDEVNGAPDFTVYKGEIWNFTIEPIAIPITDITATASSAFGASVADNTIDGSGMTGDLHGTGATDMWISGGVPASISWAFDRAYKLHEMWVWNSNQTIETFIGFGAKDIVIEHSLDGEKWTALEGVSELAQAPGLEGYAANNIIDFGGATAQHVRMSINTVQGFAPQASLSEVRFFFIPTFPTGPNPVSGAPDVAADVLLSWDRDGREAAEHDVYLGSDPNALPLAGTVTESRFDTLAADLALGQTYYWQVVEVNDAMDPSEWAGDLWSFTTVGSIAIDDMESYRDEEFLEIWATWIDGFDDPGNNGAIVGAVPSLGDFSPETERVYGGGQSLPMHFDNSGAPRSEATRTFGAALDWSNHGVQSLVLFFGGSPANTGGQLYVKINDTKVSYDGASSDLMNLGWNKWTIPLSSINASTLSRVTSLTIGIEGNGSGVVYVDEIQLTEDARVVVMPTDPSAEALVAHYAFDGDASDSTGQSPGTLFGVTSFVAGADGQALRLDGINAYVAIDGLFYDSSGLPEVTVAAWIRTDIEDNQIIASFDRNEYWRLEINGDGGGPGQVGWDVMTDTGQIDSGSSSRVDDNEWHHVAGVFDNGTATIYIDGYHEPPATGGSTFGSGNTRFGYVGLGSESTTFNADPRTPASFFLGDVDDVRIYQRALSAAEVAGMAGRTEPFDKP